MVGVLAVGAGAPVGQIVLDGVRAEWRAAVRAAYDAPYPDESYKAGARVFPALVPIRPDDPASDAVRAARGCWRSGIGRS